MTLPFRRRHHDNEASHDRARAIAEAAFAAEMTPADTAWLEQHLAGCTECAAEQAAFAADRELLRTLRDESPAPPRDLWARTAAAIERDAGHRPPAGRRAYGGPRIGRLPIGVLSGVLVILVVIGTSLVPRTAPLPSLTDASATSITGRASPPPEPTPLAVTARALTYVQKLSDGSFDLVVAPIGYVCADGPDACAPLDTKSSTRIRLSVEPESVIVSPNDDQLVVTTGREGSMSGEVIVLPKPTTGPTPGPTDPPSSPPSEAPRTDVPPTDAPPPSPTPDPDLTPVPTDAAPSQTPDPAAGRAIVTGVIVVGETAYSANGEWLAFSARPVDGSAGPDLYVWRVGDELARPVTADHATFFAGWLGDRILASRIMPVTEPLPGEPGASAGPSASPAMTAKPGRSPNPGSGKPSPSPDFDASAAPTATDEASALPEPTAPVERHPVSFLLDPLSGTMTTIDGVDVWQPVVDLESRTVVYWSGTVLPDASGTGWVPATGQLLLDGWSTPDPVQPSRGPGESGGPSLPPNPTIPGPSVDPLASPDPTPRPGPAGDPEVLAEGPVGGFDARFDPEGIRLAVWIPDPENSDIGTLRLVVIDASTGRIDPALNPLPGVPAARGFSIAEGRLAWITPPGQDGEATHVDVLAWDGSVFGQVRSVGVDRLLVVR